MSDPAELIERLEAVEDAFSHARGRPTFEPELNSAPNAREGEVQIQKACRFLDLINRITSLGPYYGAILEHSFIVIEHTLQGYLLAMTGTDASELRDHTSPYEFAKGQVPLSDDTIDSLVRIYDARRTEHYYGTTVTTEAQAQNMREVATVIHEHVVSFDHRIEQFCHC